MLRITCSFLVLIFLVAPSSLAKDKMRIALLDLEPKNAGDKLTLAITDFLRVELVKRGGFEVLDRDNMKAILEEQAFQQSGCTSAECAVEVGQILNCQKIFVGALSKIGSRYFLSVQRVDVETARVDFADSVEAPNEDALPDVAAVLAERMTKGKAGKARRGRLYGEGSGRRYGVSVAVTMCGGWSTTHHVSDREYRYEAASLFGGMLGLRYLPHSADWLSFELFLLGMGKDDHTETTEYEAGGLQIHETTYENGLGFSLGARGFFDVGRKLGLADNRLRPYLGFGRIQFECPVRFRYSASGPEMMETDAEVQKDFPFLQVGLALGVWAFELQAGGIFPLMGDGVLSEGIPDSGGSDAMAPPVGARLHDSTIYHLAIALVL